MQHKIYVYNEIIAVVMNFLISFTMFLTVQVMILHTLAPPYVQVLFLLCYAAVIVIRLFINGNFVIYMIAHFTLYLTLFMIPLLNIMFIIFVVYLVAMTVRSVSYWRGNVIGGNGEIPWISIVLLVISYIYAFASHYNLLKNYLLVVGSLYLLLFLIRFYLKGLYDLSHNQILYKQLPLNQIVRSNSYMIGMLLVITLLAILLANLINLDNLLYVIADGLVVVLRVLIKGFFAILSFFANMFRNLDFVNMRELWDSLGRQVTEEGLASKIFNIVMAVMKIVLTALFLFYVGRRLNRKIRQFLKDNILPTDKVERIKMKENGLELLVENLKKRRKNEPKSPIRRRYKKAVRRFGKRLVLPKSVTTGQIEAQLTGKEAEEMRPLKEAYERERYRDEL